MGATSNWGVRCPGCVLALLFSLGCDSSNGDGSPGSEPGAGDAGGNTAPGATEPTDTGEEPTDTGEEPTDTGEEPTGDEPTGEAGAGATDEAIGDAGEPDGACSALPTFEFGLEPARELFVDASAAGPGDGSALAPFPTLEEAFFQLEPGTAIRIRPGTYPGGAFVSNAHGTAASPIWIGGVPGEPRPVISGGSNALQLSPASYLIVHDLELSGQSSNGLNVDDGEVASGASHHLVFRNLLIHELGDGGNQDCLKLSGVSDHFVLDSEFRGCSGGSAVDHVGCQRGVIARNLFAELGGNGVQSKGGSDDILITQNRFLEAGERAVNMGGSTGFEFFRPALSTTDVNFEARNVRVVANVFRGGTSPIAFVGCVSCLAAHNTLIDPERWVLRILQETTSTEEYEFAPAQEGRFVNNLVYYSRALLSTHVNVGPDTAPESFEFANNLWYAHDEPAASTPDSLPAEESAGVYGEDPALADPGAGGVAITAASPAAGAGIALVGVSSDLDGACFGQPPSVGALEAQ
jgi:hypothetical protein